MVDEVEVVYKCFVCPKAFSSVQALRGHMRVHRGVEVGDLHVRLPKAKIEEFLAFCRRHNASSCHMILSMIDAYIEGDKRGLIQVGSPNPAIVHLQQVFPSRPRGHGKYDLSGLVGVVGGLPRIQCNYFGGVCEGKVYCRNRCYAWLPWEKCGSCEYNRVRSVEP